MIGQGIAKHVFELLTVALGKSYNHSTGLKYIPTKQELEDKQLKNETDWPYTFDIPEHKLVEIGSLIEGSRATIPSVFSSKWENLIKQSGGNRGVDWIDFLLYMVPTLFVPALTHEATKKPLLLLSKACARALKWEITSTDLSAIET